MKLGEILNGVPWVEFHGDQNQAITDISYSSQNVQPGHLFAALKGIKTDGFLYVDTAVAAGAVAILSEREKPVAFPGNWIQVKDARAALAMCSANFFQHPSQHMSVIGITGTKGKTTITYILEGILLAAGFQPGVFGTISYRGPGIHKPASRTTPEAPDLQKMMRSMLDHGATHCIMEISSHALDLNRVLGIDFNISVFTNLSGEHLDYHKSMEDYFAAKTKLFSLGNKNLAVVNTDDTWGQKLMSQLSTNIFTFGLEPGALVYAENYTFNPDGIEAMVKFPAGRLSLSSALLGKPNLYNILAAVAVALTLDVPLPAIKAGVAGIKGVPGRFEKIKNSLGLNIFVDYAHSDDALRNLLETAQDLCKGRIILVFGAGGDRDKTKRPRMGEIAGKLADWAILTSDNPRSEDPLDIIADVEAGLHKVAAQNYEVEPDRKKAIHIAIKKGKKDDYILIAGKGHEDYQIIKDKILFFDDAQVAREILQDMGKN